MPSEGYMDAAGIDTPDAGDDTLRLEIAAALILHDHPEQNSLTRPDEPMLMLHNDPKFHVCRKALARADALLPLIREHTAAAWDEGWRAGQSDEFEAREGREREETPNPYRETDHA